MIDMEFTLQIIDGATLMPLMDKEYLIGATESDIRSLEQLEIVGVYDGSGILLGGLKTLPMQFGDEWYMDVHAYIPKENRRHSLQILKQYSSLLLSKGYKIHTSTDKGYEQVAKMLVKLLGFTITHTDEEEAIHLIKTGE